MQAYGWPTGHITEMVDGVGSNAVQVQGCSAPNSSKHIAHGAGASLKDRYLTKSEVRDDSILEGGPWLSQGPSPSEEEVGAGERVSAECLNGEVGSAVAVDVAGQVGVAA
jgi:hypothetical protein